jgi:YhcH/YjgK/YiaL family protein
MKDCLSQRIEEALKYIKNLDVASLISGKYVVGDDFFYIVQEYDTKSPEQGRYESHKKYVDIQYLVEGCEHIAVTASAFMEPDGSYNEETDVQFLKDSKHASNLLLTSGKYVILYPKDAHKPGLTVDNISRVKKILGKVRI